VKEVLKRPAMNDLVISPEKYIWGDKEVQFFRYILTLQGISMAIDKTKAIQECQIPKSLRDMQSCPGFANFYNQFILGFSMICDPWTESTKGDKNDWEWTPDMEKAVVDLEDRFNTVPMLTHYSPKC
jgi:hypothetical protein